MALWFCLDNQSFSRETRETELIYLFIIFLLVLGLVKLHYLYNFVFSSCLVLVMSCLAFFFCLDNQSFS